MLSLPYDDTITVLSNFFFYGYKAK